MKISEVKLYIYIVLATVYIVPNGLIFGTFSSIHNHIFAVIIFILYMFYKIKSHNVKKTDIMIWIVISIIALYTKKLGFLDMIIVPALCDLIEGKEEVKDYLSKSNVAYVCLFFTLLYTIIYNCMGIGGRGEGKIGSGLLFSAIGEINLTGLSMFCLAFIAMKKNKKLGYTVMILGLLTLSRSYILALLCVLLFENKYIKKIVEKIINRLSYFNLTIISNLLLFMLGIGYVYLFLHNGIIDYSTTAGFSRLFKLNDYSNFFRFFAIFVTGYIFIKYPKKLLLGISNDEFLSYGNEIASSYGVPFSGIAPHNIFFSHLKIYGLAVFFEIALISKYLKKIVTVNNFKFFLAIFLYGIILGTGLYNYWLYLSVIVFILYEGVDKNKKKPSVSNSKRVQ